MSLLRPTIDLQAYELGQAHGLLVKYAADKPVSSPTLAGRFYVSASGCGLLAVPNALGRGLFDALNETGVVLPPGVGDPPGPYTAHVSVMRKEEIEQIGGPDKLLNDRGRLFHYQLGPVKTVTPAGWSEMSKCWFVSIESPELKALRKSYGLPPLPVRGDQEMGLHMTFACRPKGALQNNGVGKAAAQKIPTVAVDLDGTILAYNGWQGEDHFGDIRPGALQALQEFDSRGYRIIIFTTRGRADLVRRELEKLHVPHHYVNENPDQPPGASGKVVADVYLDDRAIDARGDWEDLLGEVIHRMENSDEKHAAVLVDDPRLAAGDPSDPRYAAARGPAQLLGLASRSRLVKQAEQSHYLQALTQQPLQWQSGAGILPNLLSYVRNLKARGDLNVEHAYASNRLANYFQPGRQYDELARLFHGEPTVVTHPLDQVMQSGLFKFANIVIPLLEEAKRESDRKNYRRKTQIIRFLMKHSPQDWHVDSTDGRMHGVTHSSGWRYHIPATDVPAEIRHEIPAHAAAG